MNEMKKLSFSELKRLADADSIKTNVSDHTGIAGVSFTVRGAAFAGQFDSMNAGIYGLHIKGDEARVLEALKNCVCDAGLKVETEDEETKESDDVS